MSLIDQDQYKINQANCAHYYEITMTFLDGYIIFFCILLPNCKEKLPLHIQRAFSWFDCYMEFNATIKQTLKLNVHYIQKGGYWCNSNKVRVMMFNATFSNISVIYRGGQFYWWRKPEYLENTTDLSETTDKLYRIMLYRVPISINGVRTHNFSGDQGRIQDFKLGGGAHLK